MAFPESPSYEPLDLLGCPTCNEPFCRHRRTYATYKAREYGHITDGLYVLSNEKGQYLLFTAGLQDIKLAPMPRTKW